MVSKISMTLKLLFMLSKSLGNDYHCHYNFGTTFYFGHTFLLFDIDFIGVKRCEMKKKSEF